MNESHELISYKNKKVIGKFEIETHKIFWIDEFVCLKSKMYAFKCGNDSNNNLNGICKSYSKNIKFEEYKNCLDGNDYKKCDKYIIRSLNHEMYLQKVTKSTLFSFDDERCYKGNIKSKPWG